MKYATENNVELVDILSDPGKSGLKTNNREGFMNLVKKVRPYNWVIVYELSRLARDQQDLINTFRNLVINKGRTFICLNPHIDSRDKTSDLMIGIMSSIAQEESHRISERVKSNMNRLSEEGKLITRPPFGYVQDKETRKFIEDEVQQEVIRKMEIWNNSGVSMTEMAKRLNAEGKGRLLNNNKKQIENPEFTACNVASMLRGYGIKQDMKTPKYTYRERVENWNNGLHNSKVKRSREEEASTEQDI